MLDWLYTAIAWGMKQWHSLLSTFLDPGDGITWALSIVFLVVTVRVLLLPLFVKQLASQRAVQDIQPEIRALRQQYGNDSQGFTTAVIALRSERGVSPLAGCLPMLAQLPVFISLLHVLRRLAPGKDGLYSWTDALTDQAARAELFGAPISSSFSMRGDEADAVLEIAGYGSIRIVALVLIVVMSATTFVTQWQSSKRSGPVEGQAAMVQKVLLYGMPAGLFVTGFFFPIGVLLYWLTSNVWTLGQQAYALRMLPPPATPAALTGPAHAAGAGGARGATAPASGPSRRKRTPRAKRRKR